MHSLIDLVCTERSRERGCHLLCSVKLTERQNHFSLVQMWIFSEGENDAETPRMLMSFIGVAINLH